jgi:uncharacterized SAM-binding protein YcdF (DUF218 family)
VRRLVIAVLVTVGGLVSLGSWLFYFVGTARPQRADAIVVLAGDPRRPATGVRLLHEGVARVLELSLDAQTDAKVAALCDDRGVSCFHASADSTRGEARTVARLARRRNWHSIVIVSSRFHLRRARMLFRRCTNAQLQIVPAHTSRWEYVRNLPLETGKLLVQLTIERGC